MKGLMGISGKKMTSIVFLFNCPGQFLLNSQRHFSQKSWRTISIQNAPKICAKNCNFKYFAGNRLIWRFQTSP